MKEQGDRARKAFQLLANRARLDILLFLADGEKNVSQMVRALGFGQTLVSHNLKKLAAGGFVRVRRSGHFRYFALNKEFAKPFLAAIDPERKFNGSGLLFRSIIEQAPTVITVVDEKGLFVFASGDVQQRFGRTPHEILGKSVHALFRGTPIDVRHRQGLSGRKLRWTDERGGRTYDIVSVPYLDERGRMAGIISAATDASARAATEKALTRSLAAWRKLAQESPDLIAHVDRQGLLLDLNRAIGSMARLQAVGTPVVEYMPKEDREVFLRKLDETFRKGKKNVVTVGGLGIGRDGRSYECRLLPVKAIGKTLVVTLTARQVRRKD